MTTTTGTTAAVTVSAPQWTPPGDRTGDLYAAVDALTGWLDHADPNRPDRPDRLTQTLRILKVTEEAGEAAAAWIGATGQNPRKGVTHTVADVAAELGDVVVAALVAIRSLGRDPATTITATVAKLVDRVGHPCALCGAVMADAYPCPSGSGDGVVWVCTDLRGCDQRRATGRRAA
jgi:NTP pyrophosphatase (non-canonical NTP hydrolase)